MKSGCGTSWVNEISRKELTLSFLRRRESSHEISRYRVFFWQRLPKKSHQGQTSDGSQVTNPKLVKVDIQGVKA
jgi:hypothetical protein